MRCTMAVQQRTVVRDVPLSILAPRAPNTFRNCLSPTNRSAVVNAAMTMAFIQWLVGAPEVIGKIPEVHLKAANLRCLVIPSLRKLSDLRVAYSVLHVVVLTISWRYNKATAAVALCS